MSQHKCKHCGGNIVVEESKCPHCGIPLPPNHAKQRVNTFVLWFCILVIFCIFMMIWLPPNWSDLVSK